MKNLSILMIVIVLSACTAPEKEQKKVFYLNSYHKGYGSSDDIMKGIDETFEGEDIDLEIFYMDTKRIDKNKISDVADSVLRRIASFDPDIIIASDDNAVKYVIAPHFKEKDIPVLFCGVNWSCKQYGLPTKNITGMLEVLPVEATIDTITKYYGKLEKLAVLSENTTSERNNKSIMTAIFEDMGLTVKYHLEDNFESWKSQFDMLNNSSDVIFIPTNGAVKGWDEAEATAFISDHIKVPVFTCDDFMMKYAVYGLTKVAKEQGVWVATKALQILDGKDIADIELTKNKAHVSWFNPELADKIGFRPNERLIKESQIVD